MNIYKNTVDNLLKQIDDDIKGKLIMAPERIELDRLDEYIDKLEGLDIKSVPLDKNHMYDYVLFKMMDLGIKDYLRDKIKDDLYLQMCYLERELESYLGEKNCDSFILFNILKSKLQKLIVDKFPKDISKIISEYVSNFEY